ncbi:hypothetical protein BJ165DRAFT_875621 [Panaeolus papilionaceus]|nr:hypothetical protein BJ165DRAFT_875621 [Panaeolus papilionaceus]
MLVVEGGSTAPTRILGSGSNSSSRPPMGVPLKAAISPSAPAPALNDNDFTSFSIDGMDSPAAQSSSNNDDNTQTTGSSTDDLDTADSTPTATGTTGGAGTTTTTIPTSAARSSAASSNPAANSSPTPDFGPIGSPPNYRNPTSPTKALNGSSSNTPAATAIDLSTSPRAQGHLPSNLTLSSNNQYRNGLPSSPPISSSFSNQAIDFMSTSPFSAPGNQSVFMTGNYSPMPNVGVPASLGALPLLSGAGRASKSSGWGEKGEYDISIEYDEFTGTTASAGARSGLAMRRMRDERDSAVEDEDLDLLPGSLSDLLTPEERKRRMSRNGQQGRGDAGLRELREGMGMMGIGNNNNAASQGQEAGGMLGHRYSRSVPAPTLLSDIKSIWADSNTGLPSSPARSGLAAGAPSAGSATGGVFGSPFAATPDDALSSAGLPGSLGGGGFVGGTPSSVGMMSLSPSNASAAFLPGLHRHYSNAKAKAASQAQAQAQQLGLGAGAGAGGLSRQMRGASGPSLLSVNAASGAGANNNNNTNSLASNYLLSSLQAGLPSSAGAASTLHGSMAGGGTGGAVHTHTHGGTQTTYRTTPSPFDLTGGMRRGGIGATLGSGGGLDSTSTSLNPLSSNMGMGGLGSGYGMGAGGGLGGNGAGGMGPSVALSPGTKALNAHAPGQSLPQGLAAGYSRIHALPPVNLRDIVGSASSSSGLGGAGLSGSYTGAGGGRLVGA